MQLLVTLNKVLTNEYYGQLKQYVLLDNWLLQDEMTKLTTNNLDTSTIYFLRISILCRICSPQLKLRTKNIILSFSLSCVCLHGAWIFIQPCIIFHICMTLVKNQMKKVENMHNKTLSTTQKQQQPHQQQEKFHQKQE